MAIFAAVSMCFWETNSYLSTARTSKASRRNWVKIATVGLVLVMCVLLVFRSDVVYGRIMEASVFYSTTDIKAYDAGVWLSQNYPNDATVVVRSSWVLVFNFLLAKTLLRKLTHCAAE